MSRGKAIVLGIFTAWPILYMALFMCLVFGMMFWIELGQHEGRAEPPMILLLIIPLHFLTMLVMLVLLVIYIVHVFKTDRGAAGSKSVVGGRAIPGECDCHACVLVSLYLARSVGDGNRAMRKFKTYVPQSLPFAARRV